MVFVLAALRQFGLLIKTIEGMFLQLIFRSIELPHFACSLKMVAWIKTAILFQMSVIFS